MKVEDLFMYISFMNIQMTRKDISIYHNWIIRYY